MRLGIIAPEFPPAVGGMQAVAARLSELFARQYDVTVFLRANSAPPSNQLHCRRILTGRLEEDESLLREAPVDLWFATNAGLTPLAETLRGPFFAYFHGNDFLNPWIGYTKPWIQWATDLPGAWRLRRRLYRIDRRRQIRRGLSCVTRVFANSRATAQTIATHFPVASGKISVVPPGVEDTFFQERRPSPNGTLRILTVSRLTVAARRKNVDGVLRALALINDVPFRYTVVGDGDDRPRLEQLASQLGIRQHVRFLGQVSEQTLLDCYRSADLFVLASKRTARDVEGFGIVYLEASASGVPVMCNAQGGATDAVKQGTNGIMLASASPRSIATGIRQFLDARASFSASRVRAFAEDFRWPLIAERISTELKASLN